MQISDTVKSIETLIGSLKDLKLGLNDTINSTTNNKLKDNVDSSTKLINGLKKAMNFGIIFAGLKKGLGIAKDVAMANIDMVETNNLFEVSMGKVVDQYGNLDEIQSQYYVKALAFQDEMNKKLLTNKAELKEFQAMYYSMFKSQGIDKDTSYLLSENLTKAGYDIASLYNLTVDDAMSKLRSGIAGQVEPLRKIGVDISESSLQKVLDDAGIDRKVQQLSYAEKEVARYIAILNQAGQAQGDFAKTMDNSANQIKIFKNQIAELKQVAGAFIVNVFGNILVYVNAIIMVVKEILKSFATLFGYDLDLGGSSTSLSGISDTVDDIGTGLGTATKNAKELKKQLMGFDEINNISPNSQTNGSGGTGGASMGGIDSKLLNDLKEWDNMMNSISGKAQDIRDKILDWLGVTDGSYNNLKKIWEIVKAIGIAFATWKISSTITNFLNSLGILSKLQAFQVAFGFTLAITGFYLLYNGVKKLLDGDADIFSILETLAGGSAVSFGIASLLHGLSKGYISWGRGITIGLGITLLVTSIMTTIDNMAKSNAENALSVESLAKDLGAGLEAGLGTFLVTKNVKLSLIVGSVTFGWNTGWDIGTWLNGQDWIQEEYQHYIDVFNIDDEENPIMKWIKGIGGVLGTLGDIILQPFIALGEEIVKFFNGVGKTIEDWWKNDVAPWFTKEKWQEVGNGIKEGLSNKWDEFKDWWKDTALVQWWDNHVAPWFTKEKWQEVANNAKTGIENKFTEWKEKFKPVSDWWNDKIKPWFTIQKWKDKVNEGITGIKNGFTEWKNNFHPVSEWWNNKIKPWFTIQKWKDLARDAVQGIKDAFSNFNFHIKLPHFTWTSTPATGWVSKVLSALNLPTSLPKLNVSWYAKGGMPDVGEMFVARESGPEMVGKIGNKTTVANNDQIVTAIKQGVYEAVSNAMADGHNEVTLNVRAEEGVIVEKAAKGFTEYVMQTGDLPFPVPVG